MAGEILNATRIEDLRVLGRSSSFRFRGKNVPPHAVGQQLGVARVLTGWVPKQGNELRITVEPVRTSDGVQQWSNRYDGNLANMFKLQDACVREVASELDITLGSPTCFPRPANQRHDAARITANFPRGDRSALAIGLVVVVLGVSTGLRVPNWNGNRKTDATAVDFTRQNHGAMAELLRLPAPSLPGFTSN